MGYSQKNQIAEPTKRIFFSGIILILNFFRISHSQGIYITQQTNCEDINLSPSGAYFSHFCHPAFVVLYFFYKYFMKNINNLRSLGVIFLIVITLPLLLSAIQTQKKYRSKAGGALSQIYIDTAKTTGPIAQTWRALAQGGEEKGVRMLSNVIGQITELSPRYIRIDHIYYFYDVASRNPVGSINLNFRNLDQTVCDILRTNAK